MISAPNGDCSLAVCATRAAYAPCDWASLKTRGPIPEFSNKKIAALAGLHSELVLNWGQSNQEHTYVEAAAVLLQQVPEAVH